MRFSIRPRYTQCPASSPGTSAATKPRSRLSTSTGNRSTDPGGQRLLGLVQRGSIRPATGGSIRLQPVGPMHGEDLLRPTGLAIERR